MKFVLITLAACFVAPAVHATSASATSAKLSPAQLEQLVAPIALYPDPLLGLILPAAVFPEQIVDAALLIKSKSDAAMIAQQTWDSSVKGVATYPGVLKMMYERIDWTARLGNAFLNQSAELRLTIQNLREKAQRLGNLKSTVEQKVSTASVNGETVIRIEPTEPQSIYVPQYSTQTVYSQPTESSSNYLVPLAAFGLGAALGASAADDDDDDIYVYGGYPGGVVWYDDDAVEHWANNRQDMIRDAQSHRQEMSRDRLNFNQDMRKNRQDFRQDQLASGNYPDKAARDQFRQQQSAKRQEYRSNTQESRQNYRNNYSSTEQSQQNRQRRQQAQQKSQEWSSWKSSAADRGWATSPSTARQNYARSTSGSRYRGVQGSALDSYSSRSAASAYRSRGSASRYAGGFSSGGRGMSRGGRGGGRRR